VLCDCNDEIGSLSEFLQTKFPFLAPTRSQVIGIMDVKDHMLGA
jgi:hypothetical protein